jgi:hypothetical protein
MSDEASDIKKPAFFGGGFKYFVLFIYTSVPPPVSAGIIMTTTTSVVTERITLFTVLFNMKEVLYCEYTPANFNNKELFILISTQTIFI